MSRLLGPPGTVPHRLVGPQKISSSVNTEFGFLVSTNQFNVLQESEPATSTSQVQGEDSLVNPRTTRLQRLQATRRAKDQGYLLNEGVFGDTIPPNIDNHAFFSHSLFVSPTEILNGPSVGNFELKLVICMMHCILVL